MSGDIQQAYKYIIWSFQSHLKFFDLKVTNILKSTGWELGKSELPWEQNFFTVIRVFPVELLTYQVSVACAANWPRFINLLYYWVEYMMPSVISFAYFTHFANLNISGTNADIFKR